MIITNGYQNTQLQTLSYNSDIHYLKTSAFTFSPLFLLIDGTDNSPIHFFKQNPPFSAIKCVREKFLMRRQKDKSLLKYRSTVEWGDAVCFWKGYFPITQSVFWSVGRWFGTFSWTVWHNFLKGRKVTLPCSYRSTC